MRNYKKELQDGLNAHHWEVSYLNRILPSEFFEPMKSDKYKSMQGVLYSNFYLNEFLCKRTVTELKKAREAIIVYKKNHGFSDEKKSYTLIELELLWETLLFQIFTREKDHDAETMSDTYNSYIKTKSMLEQFYKEAYVSASEIGATMIAMYNQAMEEYEKNAVAVEMSYAKLERIMSVALGAAWVKELADFIGCSEFTIYKWKEGKVPPYAVYDAQNIIQKKIEELNLIKNSLM